MGAGMEMRGKKTAAFVFALFWLLAGCGTDPVAQESRSNLPERQAVAAMVSGLFVKPKPTPVDPTAVAAVRRALEQAGQPVLLVRVPSIGYANLFAPYGQNGAVTTWASASHQSIALQGGLLVATRGFGPDLMSANVPTLAQVLRGAGTFRRDYFDLDGADQNRHLRYSCTFSQAGFERIEIFGAHYPTRKVAEFCRGPDLSFENAYWFDADGSLRQSAQRAVPGLPLVQIGRVVN